MVSVFLKPIVATTFLAGRRRSFVHRLRSMAAEMNAAETLSVDEIAASGL